MGFQQTITSPTVCEKKTAKLTLQLTDEAEANLALASITTCVLTLYEESGGTVINSRTASDIKNANGGVIDSNGSLALTLAVADNALIAQSNAYEWHVALIEWTYSSGTKAGAKEIRFKVVNQTKVT